MKYPQMLYKSPGPHEIHGGHFDYLIVADKEAADAALANGWYETTGEAKAAASGDKRSTDHDDGQDKDALLAQAKALGIDAKGTWGVKKLQEAIAAASGDKQD